MPIPLLIPPQEDPSAAGSQGNLMLVPVSHRVDSYLFARTVAHCIDLMLVQGVSIYAAKFFTLLLVSMHMSGIRDLGRMAGRVFREAMVYGQNQLGLTIFFVLSVAYFVVLPALGGRTLGLGLLGFRLETVDGRAPGLREMGLRYVGCVLMYLTGGVMLVSALKRVPKSLFHDRLSGTRLVPTRQ